MKITGGTIRNAYIEVPKDRVDKLREITKNWSNGATMMAINEELQGAISTEERLELLTFKSDVLESAIFGKVTKVD